MIGRLLTQDSPIDESAGSGSITTIAYKQLRTEVTNALGAPTSYVADPVGRTVTLEQYWKDEDGNNDTTLFSRYTYDAIGNLLTTLIPDENPNPQSGTEGSLTVLTYNDIDQKITMDDPNMGFWEYGYSLFNELKYQKDAKAQETFLSYDQLGRLTQRSEVEGNATFTYDSASGAGKGQLHTATSPNGYTETYVYDSLGRTSQVTTQIGTETFLVNTTYDPVSGGLKRLTYPESVGSGFRFAVDYSYDVGYLDKVTNAADANEVFYQLDPFAPTDGLGNVTAWSVSSGSISKELDFDQATGQLATVKTSNGSLQDLAYQWDKVGNLTQRKDVRQTPDKTEDFVYDTLNRLEYAKQGTLRTTDVNYNAGGNIKYKSGVGNYVYAQGVNAGPNAVTTINGGRSGTFFYDANGNMKTKRGDTTDWYSFNKPERIEFGTNFSEFDYGPFRSRFKQQSETSTTLYISGIYERNTAGSTVTHKHYVLGAGQAIAIHNRRSASDTDTYYVHTDHLGSMDLLTDGAGTDLQRYSFDPFGKRRWPDWSNDTGDVLLGATPELDDRGFTLHEHLDNVASIHMNGRVYDPIIGRFTSADPFVQAPFHSQSFNRFSYVFNNPLSFTDPSGFMCDSLDGPCPGPTPHDGGTRNPHFFEPTDHHGNQSVNLSVVTTSNPDPATDVAPVFDRSEYAHFGKNASMRMILEQRGVDTTLDLDAIQSTLDAAGLAGPVGPPADAINAIISLARGDLFGAGANVVGIVPVFGDTLKVGLKASRAKQSAKTLVPSRGSGLGGVFSHHRNSVGGRVFTSKGSINQADFEDIVQGGLQRGDNVHILSGVHGAADGTVSKATSFVHQDIAKFGNMKGVTVHDVTDLSPTQLQDILEGPGTIIGAFCDSGSCLR